MTTTFFYYIQIIPDKLRRQRKSELKSSKIPNGLRTDKKQRATLNKQNFCFQALNFCPKNKFYVSGHGVAWDSLALLIT